MRTARVLGDPANRGNYYHVLSRAIEGRSIFDETAKMKWCGLLNAYAEFTGIRVITWCCLNDCWRLLAEVPNAVKLRANVGDEELLRRLAFITDDKRLAEIRARLAELQAKSPKGAYRKYREQLLGRIGDLPVFMRELNQRFTQWYNRRAGRRGPLWENRYKSVLVEGEDHLLREMAAFIDRSPVQAGLVKDPFEYRWSGYGAAAAGNKSARAGLMSLYQSAGGEGRGAGRRRTERPVKWRECQAAYRRLLLGAPKECETGAGVGERTGKRKRTGTGSKRAAEAKRSEEDASAVDLVRRRERYFSEGLALGSAAFVEEVFARNRRKLNVKRKRGAREARGGVLGEWRTLMDLRGWGGSASDDT